MNNSCIFKSFDVWKLNGQGRIIRYRCFEENNSRQFCVKSADFYCDPIDEKQIRDLDKQHFELLLGCSPDLRNGFFGTIADAINAHKGEFQS